MKKFITVLLFLMTGCYRVGNKIEPQINYAVQDRYLKTLPSAFLPLSEHERSEDWGREDRIGQGFAAELDLYQALTAFKRASFLLPPALTDRKFQLDYDILFSYYLGRKYAETIYAFDHSSLRQADPTFAAYHDLLVILYDSYLNLHDSDKTDKILYYLATAYPETAQKLDLSTKLLRGQLSQLEPFAATHPDVDTLLSQYAREKKSTKTAQTLNALLPGAGYLYVGQKQSALTALLLNGSFIWASVYFFQHGNIPAGIIFTSVEAGWYFGGIYGAGEAAKFYNERLYERLATPLMNEQRYFPILMLKYGF